MLEEIQALKAQLEEQTRSNNKENYDNIENKDNSEDAITEETNSEA